MNALGFELSTIFYGAFMRWYATLMPTATVFRFWDALLFQSTNPKTQSLGGRDYLINLAFATLQVKRNELMECESAAEMKGVVLGFLGSLYDTTTVIDLVHAADLYLWGGAGFSSGKVSYLWTQRDEMFKGINQTTKWQNQILHRLAFEGQVRPPKHPSAAARDRLESVTPCDTKSHYSHCAAVPLCHFVDTLCQHISGAICWCHDQTVGAGGMGKMTKCRDCNDTSRIWNLCCDKGDDTVVFDVYIDILYKYRMG
ncbi:unnamed protein product [Cladocopium goreaui]|uniref:Rab-GAP TBC domain-containing protein n=1 Tax=Cladocopium goreaui TaxID=2562237 RepID=A0A9P1FX22_9DINO|nr:unnamed protein product [Cladocopium goreaui]